MDHHVATLDDLVFQDLTRPMIELLDTSRGGRQSWTQSLLCYHCTADSGDDMEIPVPGGSVNLSWNGHAIGFEHEAVSHEGDLVATLGGRHLLLFGVSVPDASIPLMMGRPLSDLLTVSGTLSSLNSCEMLAIRKVPLGIDIDLAISTMTRWSRKDA